MQENPISNIDSIIEMDSSERMISIGLLAESVTKQTGQRCTPEMIDNYEKHGLIHHSSRMKGGGRLFSIADIQTVICIKYWQSQGLKLSEIKEKLKECPQEVNNKDGRLELPDDRRTQILRIAARIFPQKGYEATTMQDIAEEADISVSLIYQFFRSKEELFLAFAQNASFTAILNRMIGSLGQQKVSSMSEARQALIDVAVNFTRDHAGKVELFRLLISTSRNFPELGRNYLHNFIEPAEQLLTQYFDHLVNQGFFREIDTRLAAKMFFGILADTSFSRNFYSGYETPVIPDENEIKDMIDLFLRGVQK